VDVPKILRAMHWAAEDIPLEYMFSYKAGSNGDFSTITDLRVHKINAPTQKVRCFKQGDAANNFYIEVNVTVTTLYGASTSLAQPYKSLPPTNPDLTRSTLLADAAESDGDSRLVVLSCISLISTSPTPAAGVSGDTSATDTVTSAPVAAIPGEASSEIDEAVYESARQMIELSDSATPDRATTPSEVENGLAVPNLLLSQGIITDNMPAFVEKMTEKVSVLADEGENDENVDRLAKAVFNTAGAMGRTMATRGRAAAAVAASSVSVNSAQNGVFFPSSQWSQSAPISGKKNQTATAWGTTRASGVRAGQRRLSDLYPELGTAPRKLTGPLDEVADRDQYIVQPGIYPDWNVLPEDLRDPEYTTKRIKFRPQSVSVGSSSTDHMTMIESQEKLELEWISFIKATNSQENYIKAQSALDDEYFANYSAHLDPAEREIVVREWWEERARVESQTASASYQDSKMTQQVMSNIRAITATLVKHMVTGENTKEFNFPMGGISIGKTKDLTTSGQSFRFEDQKWKLSGDNDQAYGFGSIKFTEVNPMSWATESPKGPFLVNSLEVFREDGSYVPVQREPKPLSIMSEHSSFASASCYYWDWQENNGLGGWSQNGVLNNENGCTTTHLSIIGMFLDVVASDEGIEMPSSMDAKFEKLVTEYNYVVICAMSGVLMLGALLHFWGSKQDEKISPNPWR